MNRLVFSILTLLVILYVSFWFSVRSLWDRNLRDVLNRSSEVFGSWSSASCWLFTPCVTFNGKMPIDVICKKDGRQLVMNLLGQIEHGIY